MNSMREPADSSRQGGRLLVVVDGDANHLFYTSCLLQRFEYRVTTAASGSGCLGLLSAALPMLVITAQKLPDMSGADLIRRLRHNPLAAAIPVITLVQPDDQAGKMRCLEAGAAACLAMPVNAHELYRAVQAAVEPTPRRNIRIDTRLPLIVNGTPLDCSDGECATVLSEHGMYVRTRRPFPRSTRLEIQLRIQGRAILVDSEVLYSHHDDTGPFREPGMGLRFARIAPEDQDFLRAFIHGEVMRGIKPV